MEELQQWVDEHAFEIHEGYKIKNFERIIQDRRSYIVNNIIIRYEWNSLSKHDLELISPFNNKVLFRLNVSHNSNLHYFKFL